MRILRKVLMLAGATVVITPAAYSQAFGDIRGSVFDSSGAAITDCPITVKNQETNQLRRALTNVAGLYDVPDLVPGPYTVTAERSGFQTAVRTDVALEVGQGVRVDFTLQVRQVAESVQVAGNAQLIDTSTTAVGTVIENKDILELPLNGRDPLQLVALSPDVTYRNTAQGLVSSLPNRFRSPESVSSSTTTRSTGLTTAEGSQLPVCCRKEIPPRRV